MNFVEMMTEKDTFTANGAVTNSTSHNYNLDLFFIAGACRKVDESTIFDVIDKSYSYNKLKTLKIIFWAGDIRQGAGERRFFKLALSWLSKNHPEDIQNNLIWIPEFSRWDVIFNLAMENEVLFSFIIANLMDTESKGHALLCKWLPRKSSVVDKKKVVKSSGNLTSTTVTRTKRTLYNGLASKIQKRLGITPKQYRKILVAGTKVVEQQMCAKKWNEIHYPSVPSIAMNKYNKAWYRNDEERFTKYIEDVKNGKSKINAGAIFPHDIIKEAVLSNCDLNEAKVAQWNALPNWLDGKPNSMIPVCDVSGSMTCSGGVPLAMSVALGLYISERNVGPFKDAIITFSNTPKFELLHGDLNRRLRQLKNADWGWNTDLTAVFRMILSKAVAVQLAPEYMPKTILVISDMEFDEAGDLTNHEAIKNAYIGAGYECPQIAYWNVNGRPGNVPVTVNDQGVCLLSGASPSVIKAVLTNELDPVKCMDLVIESERYSVIK